MFATFTRVLCKMQKEHIHSGEQIFRITFSRRNFVTRIHSLGDSTVLHLLTTENGSYYPRGNHFNRHSECSVSFHRLKTTRRCLLKGHSCKVILKRD